MIQTGFESKVKVQDLINSQIPSFILDESPKTVDFLKQYYISQEYQGGPSDITDNLDQYLKVDNLKPEVIVDNTTLEAELLSDSTVISVSSTKGFPNEYGILKIDDEIITYTGLTTNSFTGCIRGFSGITDYHQDLNQEELVFSTSTAEAHSSGSTVQNLSSLFLKEFYKKLKYTFTPGLEDITLSEKLDVGNFIKRAKDFYESKGTDESIKILFKVIFGEIPSIINLENYLIKPSSANYVRREVCTAKVISGDPLKISGQTLFKSNDLNTNASVSFVEKFTRKEKDFYKIELYVGNNDKVSSTQGNFIITPNTKLVESSNEGDTILTVDSTVGFPESGSITCENNKVSYSKKTVNQFIGCSGVKEFAKTSEVSSEDTYFSYEDGDTSKKVEIILLGVTDDIVEESEDFQVSEGDILLVKNIGDKIKDNSNNWKEIFANSWIYNTSTRHKFTTGESGNLGIKLESIINKSSLKFGDEVEILEKNSETVVKSTSGTVSIETIDSGKNTLTLTNRPNLSIKTSYDLRRKLNKSSESGENFKSGSILSDVLNLYVDGEEYAYVASNSLPSQTIDVKDIKDEKGLYRYEIDASVVAFNVNNTDNIGGKDSNNKFTQFKPLASEPDIPFITGDKVYYSSESEPLIGLSTGFYYVEKAEDSRSFKLYASPNLIESGNNLSFEKPSSGIGTHSFILSSQIDKNLGIQGILRKFPLGKNIENGLGTETLPGYTGMLINGVEISNYKSKDFVYYGPIESTEILSGGEDFDVINLPLIDVAVGAGNTAKIQPVISGSLKKVYIDSQDYNINNITSISISGGNGKGASIEPVLVQKSREVLFDGESFTNGGGVVRSTNQILFLKDHNFSNGEQIVYNSLGNDPILLGSVINNYKLPNDSVYYANVDSARAITLFNTLEDQQAGINTVGIYTGTGGLHKFSTLASKKQVSYVKILNEGEGYTNRKLIVKPTGISTTRNTINFKNHNFNDGEIIEYDYETTSITGLNSANQYQILKVDNDSFRLCDAGIGGTITSNYETKNYINLQSTGNGYQYFKYPDISVSIEYNPVGLGTTSETQKLVTTPVVKGSIIDTYLYENGTGYGSTVLNYQKNPRISVKNGRFAELKPVIVNGSIDSVVVAYNGIEYYSVPDLIVSGSGTGAELRSVINNGQITEVKVINAGTGYLQETTKIQIVPSGKKQIINSNIRKLQLNDKVARFSSGQSLQKGKDKLQYSVLSYFDELKTSFGDDDSGLKIIGWAYDGNPIYNSRGHSDPENRDSVKKKLESGYVLDISNVDDRPSGFSNGFFVEDYKFTAGKDLDQYNGRYEKTPEFPNGVYAYHATEEFPYFIGNVYKSKLISDSDLDQSFDFNNSNLLRNTLPYKVSEENSDYDFINETSNVLGQEVEVVSVTSGPIETIDIQSSGENYKVGDELIFDNTGTSGSGLKVEVASVKGKSITNIETTSISETNSVFTWKSKNEIKVSVLPYHNFKNLDYVTISGFGSSPFLNGTYRINVPSYDTGRCISTILSTAAVGFTTEIYVFPIPNQISVGSSITIGNETLSVLGSFRDKNILRVQRGATGVSHTVGTAVTFLPDSFTFLKSVDEFNSKVNDKVFFNPKESVGVGINTGVGYSTSFVFGETNETRQILARSIYIENHPFKTNQPLVVTSDTTGLQISTDGGSSTGLPSPSNVFAINKGPNIIGLKTEIGGQELFFHDNGDDSDKYSLESTFIQLLGNVDKNETTVSVSTSHNLSNGDSITLNVQPNLSVGIGTSTAIRVLNTLGSLVFNPIGFSSSNISTSTNYITLNSHGLETGDKILYSSDDSTKPVDDGEYFVHKVDDDNIEFGKTYLDVFGKTKNIVSFANTGGSSQSISIINPQIKVIKNNDLVFDLSDSSLEGYEFKIYKDENFKDEFKSTGKTSTFNVSGVGTVGVSIDASLTLKYDSSIPYKLYYNLEKSGNISTSNIEVVNNNEILYVDSTYNNSYTISGIGTTTFNINLAKSPERVSYSSTECDILEYSTVSIGSSGPVNSLNIISSGNSYKKLPTLKSTNSSSGNNLTIIPRSKKIGSISQLRTINDRFTYSSDKTLRPKVLASPTIVLENSNTIEKITVISGGKGYTELPDYVLINSSDRSVIDSGLIDFTIVGSSIVSARVNSEPKGLPDVGTEIFTVNNSNGISVEKVETLTSNTFKCTISTPTILGIATFRQDPFQEGDEVFIEGIQKSGSIGDGFNSSDYGYRFLKVTNYDNTGVNDTVTIEVSDKLTSNIGTAKIVQDFSATIIKKSDYPVFEIIQKPSTFKVGEKLLSNGIIRDLKVTESNDVSLKVSGFYDLSIGETIIGNDSGNIALIKDLVSNDGIFNVKYSNLKNIGWNNETGKLSEDYQLTPNNDYYQNLSYSIKSPITYRDQQSPVENLVHVSGMKNFADTEIIKSSLSGFTTFSNELTIIKDLTSEHRVDTINNFDLVIDQDVVRDVVGSRSKFLKLKNEKLTNYTELKESMNVLSIDDISNQFSSTEIPPSEFLNIEEIDDIPYHNFLIRVVNPEKNHEIQLVDITILSDGEENFIVENESIAGIGTTDGFDNNKFGDFQLNTNEFGETFLRFVPEDPYNSDYDLKIIRQVFNSQESGIGTQSVGFIDLTGSTVVGLGTTVGVGTATIISVDSESYNSLYINSHIINRTTLDSSYTKLYVVGAGTSTYLSEYYVDGSEKSGFNGNQIGTFYSNIENGILSITHENSNSNDLLIRSTIVGFGTTTTGIGTYRYNTSAQLDGQERSAIYESGFSTTTSGLSTTILSIDKTLFDASRSIIQVSMGATQALHQTMMVYDGSDIIVQQLPFLAISKDEDGFDESSGIGTFGAEVSSDNLILKFYPDSDMTGDIDIEIFSKSLYKNLDILNDHRDLEYGSVIESIDEKFYNGINLERINKTNFVLTDDNIPIFSKTFNPGDSSQLNASTGTFTIKNHFFANGEELIYTPGSTIEGVGIGSMEKSGGGYLQPTVYAIKLTNDTFKVSETKDGSAVTFTGISTGNAHRFTMANRNSKCIISIDGLVQYPIAFTKIEHTLDGNIDGEVGISTDIISLSGISTINPNDILLVDDEYMNVINVGLGTTNTGPIEYGGSLNLVQVKRGFVGSSASTHTDTTTARVYKGAFNIVDDQIHFAEPPRGNPQINRTRNNFNAETSKFNGRVFLKSNYDDNKVYDNISDEFTGIGKTYTLKVGGADTIGIGTEGASGLVFINSIYQSPKTDNNPTKFNYEIEEDKSLGITTISFSGVQRPDTLEDYITSDYDVNLNQLPRGGIIVSYGSTPGLGFAPLVGASVTAVVGAAGSIVSVGLGTTDNVGSGYNGLVSIGVSVFEEGHTGDVAVISATVGAGGTLTFSVDNDGGTGYNNPQIFVSDPSYENLPIIGVERRGIGATTDTGTGLLMDVIVGGVNTTGIGSTLFEVKEFKFSRSGYGFQRGDVFKPVGLVTHGSLSSPISDFTITVVDTYSDNFAAWEFGELDYLDSISQYQNGTRTRFPIVYNGELLSFETEKNTQIEKNINNVLIIFINGIIQEPGVNYIFEGGTSFVFTSAPLPEDEIDIFFYKGIDGTDSNVVDNVFPTIKTGDIVQVISTNTNQNTKTQNKRTVYNLAFSDKFETNRYSGPGIDESVYKPLSWTKQKEDKKINGEFVYKSRDSIEPLIVPTSKIIGDVSTTDTEIFVDSVGLFEYEDGTFAPNDTVFTDDTTAGFDALIFEDTNPVAATFTASIGAGGTVSGITTENSGSGYLSDQTTISLKFTSPPNIGVGIGTTATATATITNGSVSSVAITNSGFGYTVAPLIFAETPNLNYEKITGFTIVNGFSGIVTGITTAPGIGTDLALKFEVYHDVTGNYFSGIATGNPICIFDTRIGNGVTSIIDSDSAIVGIGTSFFDNIYRISDWSNNDNIGIITCNVKSDSDIIGIGTTGSILNPVGKYSWGKLSVGTRSSNPISIGVTGKTYSGLSTYPTIQRRGFGIRKTGAIPKIVS